MEGAGGHLQALSRKQCSGNQPVVPSTDDHSVRCNPAALAEACQQGPGRYAPCQRDRIALYTIL